MLPMAPWFDRARILLHVARGLVFMHSLSPPVVHRDIKCANVLLHWQRTGASPSPRASAGAGARGGPSGWEVVAKISDFGTVRVNTEQQERADGMLRTSPRSHASTSRTCGTHPYMPPGEWAASKHSCPDSALIVLTCTLRFRLCRTNQPNQPKHHHQSTRAVVRSPHARMRSHMG